MPTELWWSQWVLWNFVLQLSTPLHPVICEISCGCFNDPLWTCVHLQMCRITKWAGQRILIYISILFVCFNLCVYTKTGRNFLCWYHDGDWSGEIGSGWYSGGVVTWQIVRGKPLNNWAMLFKALAFLGGLPHLLGVNSPGSSYLE